MSFDVDATGREPVGGEGRRVAVEVERKFTVPSGLPLPDVATLGATGEPRHHDLNALYFDTPALDLTRSGSSLRRRSGGSDAGWHLKLKGAGEHARQEITAPITGARPPAVLREVLPETLAHAPLLPLARLRTSRTEWPVLSEDGRELAVVCLDEVRASGLEAESFDGGPQGDLQSGDLGGGSSFSWFEVEVEVVSGTETELEQISDALLSWGLAPAQYASKVDHALGLLGVTSKRDDERWGETAMVPVLAYLDTQVGVIQAMDQPVATNEWDAVHQCRVATRRLRSLLKTFRPLFDEDFSRHVRGELKWYAAALGEMRDGEVLDEHLRATATAVLGSDHPEMFQVLESDHTQAHDQILEVQASPRFEILHDLLARLVWDPPLTPMAAREGTQVLPALAQAQLGAAGKAYLRALQATPTTGEVREGDVALALWHTFRKKAKEVRYANEALSGFLPHAENLAASWKQVTSLFGDVQDANMAFTWLEGAPFETGSLRDAEHSAVKETLAQAILAAQDAFADTYR